ncbi:MAG: ankyrin repeat domain-containing protein [Steroidobacteraceae bacterium]|nr:ankyrin repeat domain-containing protein [Steroidobacteraceae bacterium]
MAHRIRSAALAVIATFVTCGLAHAAKPVVEAVEKDAPLVLAVRQKDFAAARALLSAEPRPDVNQTTSDGTTALHWAVYHNDVDLVERLIKAGANVNARNDYGATPMSEAAVVGNVKVLRALLEHGADVESPNADGQTALMTLARTSNVEAAKLLIKRGASVNAREQWRGQTPLMWAAAEAQPAMVKLLVEHGADVNARSLVNEWERQVTAEPRMQARPSGGFTPLLYAARKGCVECAKILVKAGADKDLTDPDGVTPLLLATLNFNFDVAAFLVEAGANVNKWDTWGRSPLYAAVDMNTLPTGGRADRPSLDKTTSLQLIEMLLKAGANPNLQLKLFPPYRSLRDDRGADTMLTVGTTPLIRAARAGDVAAMRLLLAHGANVELTTARGITPLMAAAGNGASKIDTRGRYRTEEQAIEAVKLLLAAGANVNARDESGQTALHGAARWGWNDLVKTLVAANVDLNAKDAQGRTAADIARGSSGGASGRASAEAHPETEALLRKLMAEANPPVASNVP